MGISHINNGRYRMTKGFKLFWMLVILLISSLSYADQKCPNISANSGGQCINVGAYELFMKVQGNKGPIVVFESGRGNGHDVWDKVAPEVSQFAKAVTYDRVNLSFSQNMPNNGEPVTAKQVATNLHTLLHNAKLAPPYILVGHSDGGMYVQMFSRLYPKEVAGVVFVDAASPYQTFSGGLPAKNNASYAESLGFLTSQQQIKKAPSFPKIPIIVLTATYHGFKDPNAKLHSFLANGQPITMTEAENQKAWGGWQDQIAKLSPYSMHIYAYDSDHYIQKYQPNLVVDAIYTLIKQKKK